MLVSLRCGSLSNRGSKYSVDCILTIYREDMSPNSILRRLLTQFRADTLNNQYPWKCLTRSDAPMEFYTEDAWSFTLDFAVSKSDLTNLGSYIESTFAQLMKNRDDVYLDVLDIYLSLDSAVALRSAKDTPSTYERYWDKDPEDDGVSFETMQREVQEMFDAHSFRNLDYSTIYRTVTGDFDAFYENLWNQIRPILQKEGYDVIMPRRADDIPRVCIYRLNPETKIMEAYGDEYLEWLIEDMLEYDTQEQVVADLADRLLDVIKQAESDYQGMFESGLNANRPKAPKRPKGPQKARKATKPRKPTKPTKPRKPIRPDKGR